MVSSTPFVNLPLVALSVAIAIIAIYTAIDMAGRMLAATRKLRFFWMISGTLFSGFGLWAVHFVGMLAYPLFTHAYYDRLLVLASLFCTTFTSLVAFLVLNTRLAAPVKSIFGGVVLGLGISLSHFLGVIAVHGHMQHNRFVDMVAIVLGMALSIYGLHRLIAARPEVLLSNFQKKLIGSTCWGGGVIALHYLAVSTVSNASLLLPATVPAGRLLDQSQMGYAVGSVMILLLLLNLLTMYVDRRRAILHAELRKWQYLSLFQHNPHLVILFDMTGKILSINPAVEQVLGYRPQEMMEKNFVLIVEEEDRIRMWEHIDRVRAGLSQSYELRVRHKDGRMLHLRITNAPITVEGQIIGFYVIGEDITISKELGESLRESEAKYRLIAENMSDLIAMIGADGMVLYASPSHRTVLQLASEDYVGRNVLDFIHPEDAFAAMTASRQVISEKQPSMFACRFLRADGSHVHLEVNLNPVLDNQGEVTHMAAIARDVTQRKLAERRLEESEQRYRSLFENNTDAIFSLNLRGHLTSVNPAVIEIMGYEPEEMLHRPFWAFIGERDMPKALQQYRQSRDGIPQRFEIEVRHKEGHEVTLHVHTVPIRVGRRVEGIFGIAKDITERKQSERLIYHLAYHDALTDLPNRRMFKERLAEELAGAKAGGHMLAVMFLDLDRFKVINDSLGHDVGDMLLEAVADKLRTCIEKQDLLARMGGDEFTVLLTDVRDLAQVKQTAERIMEVFRQPFALGTHALHVSTSIGIAICPRDGEDAESLMKNADYAMYRAKEQGKNRYQFYSADEPDGENPVSYELEAALRRSVERKELVLVYQPLVDVNTRKITSVEALLRWEHPERGLLTPSAFLALAEETGMTLPLGEWVLEEVFRQQKRWRQKGYDELRVSINLSSQQFQQPDFVEKVAQMIRASGTSPQSLHFEVTESMTMQREDTAIAKMHALRDMGISFSVDDFGTGYTSLGYLHRFPIDAVKIDANLIRQLPDDPASLAGAKAMISLAASLELAVVAEGVERMEQLAVLEELGCTEVQGLLFSPALPPHLLEQLLLKDTLEPYGNIQ